MKAKERAALIKAAGYLLSAAVSALFTFMLTRTEPVEVGSFPVRDPVALLNAIKRPVFILGNSGKITFANDYTSEAFDVSPAKLRGMSIKEVIELGSAYIPDAELRVRAIRVFTETWQKYQEQPRLPLHTIPIYARYPNGLEGPARVIGFPIFDSTSSEPRGLLVMIFVDENCEVGNEVRHLFPERCKPFVPQAPLTQSARTDKVADADPSSVTLATEPTMLQAIIRYHAENDEQEAAWNEIWSHMMPVCRRTSGDCEVDEIKPSHPEDARAELVLLPRSDRALGTVMFEGYGFYSETLQTADGTSVPLYWTIEFQSQATLTRDQLVAGTEIPFLVFQEGLGSRIPFTFSLRTTAGGALDRQVFIRYGDVEVATATLHRSSKYSL